MSKNRVNDTLCSSVLYVNKNIQFVTSISKHGRPIDTISRPKFTPQFQNHLSEMFFMQCVLQISMGRDFDEYYGPINYCISERENLTILSFPLDDHVILVTVNKNVNSVSLARKITDRINSFQKQSD
ncbi:MAG: hypothetical protein ACYC6W_09780 [Nitrosotalea sp.]